VSFAPSRGSVSRCLAATYRNDGRWGLRGFNYECVESVHFTCLFILLVDYVILWFNLLEIKVLQLKVAQNDDTETSNLPI
jgi:hypothetical protein